jgi:hypothetical protein
MFPLSAVLFPHSTMPLHVFEPRYRTLMRDCLEGDPRFGVVLIERGSEVGGGDVRATLGTRGVITRAAELPDGRWVLEVRGETVVLIDEWLPDDPYPLALVREPETVPDPAHPGALLVEAAQRVRRARGMLSEHGGGAPLDPGHPLDGGGDPDRAAWQICGAAPLSAYDAQRLLVADGPTERLSLLVELMDDLEQDLRRMLAGE